MVEFKDQVWEKVKHLAGWCGEDRAHMLVDLILKHRPTTIVELGVYGGKSLLAMALAAREANLPAVRGIDPWTRDANTEGAPDEHRGFWEDIDLEVIYWRFVQTVVDLKLTKECLWIRCRGEDVVRLFDDMSIDLFSLDGNHSELASCRDVELWGPKVRGRIVMDDTGWATQQKAIKSLLDQGFRIEHDTGSWSVFKR